MPQRLRPAYAVLLGALTVGTLDGLDAIVFFGLRNGVTPLRIFQSIAAGVLGRAAFSGGMTTAAFGVFLHYVIAFAMVTTFYVASRRIRGLTRHPFLYGPLYGVVAYVVMTFVVVPLSGAGTGQLPSVPVLPVLANGLLIHMLGVGLPSALFARAARITG